MAWEQNVLFLAWGAALLFALFAPRRIVWPALLGAGGAGLAVLGFADSFGNSQFLIDGILLALGAFLLWLAARSFSGTHVRSDPS